MKRRKVVYPVAKTHTKGQSASTERIEPAAGRATLVQIDLTAQAGRPGLAVGDRVRIAGTGLAAGEEAVIERIVTAGIPAAVVRMASGRSRSVRTIDLEPIGKPS